MATATLLHYIGDEIGAAGWRLAGATVHVPAPGAEASALDTARRAGGLGAAGMAGTPRLDAAAGLPPGLVLLSAATAAQLPAATLQEALTALAPLVLVVPDTQGAVPLPDFAARLRAQLGLEA